VPLSEDEQRILHQIEQQFYESDPALAGELADTSLYRHAFSRMKWATFTFVLGVVVLVVALATNTTFFVAFAGFVVMLASALWFERNVRKLGRAGWQQLSSTWQGGSFRNYLDNTTERMRERFHRDE
jgi:hypothetical protein